jgi:Prp8 binding protein
MLTVQQALLIYLLSYTSCIISRASLSKHNDTMLSTLLSKFTNLLFVCAGSSDNFVYVWDVQSGKVQYKLPGHRAVVSQVDFHPLEPIICSAGADKRIFVGEIEA